MGGGGKAPEVSETAAQLTSNRINSMSWNYYQKFYKPLMDKYITQTMSPENKEQEKAMVAGQINADVMSKIDPSKASINPAQNARMLTDLAKIESGAQTIGQAKVRGRQLGEVQNIINIGRGEEAQAQEGMESLAGSSLSKAIAEGEAEQLEKASGMNTLGSAIGGAAALGYRQLKKPEEEKPEDLVWRI